MKEEETTETAAEMLPNVPDFGEDLKELLPELKPIGAPVEEADPFKMLQRRTRALMDTSIVPEKIRGNFTECLTITMLGEVMGLPAVTAFKQLWLSPDGTPAMSAQLMRALIQREGHTLDYPTYTHTEVVARGVRHDTGASLEVSWTIEDAKHFGLSEYFEKWTTVDSRKKKLTWYPAKGGERPEWAKDDTLKQMEAWVHYPRPMLAARATSELARALFADCLGGVGYTPPDLGGVAKEEDNESN